MEFRRPQVFELAGRRPTRLPRLYARLERSCASLHEFFYAWGTTEEDRALAFPCDSYVSFPRGYLYRGVEVGAPREIVYRWLCQLRVAPYAYDWLDNFGRQSPRRLTPGVQRLAPGQAAMVIFTIVELAQDEHITMLGDLLELVRGRGQTVAMTYRVVPTGASSCRIVVKLTAHYGADTLPNRIRRDAAPIIELPLMRKQLLTLKCLAEKQFQEELADGCRVSE